ncbi:hypothetical protein ACLIKC_06690 [Klebsiella aerogenes]|uniref:hypothetical protein n=1 Tax=Klebsiella aerogenes TaxID=548 RepID=UPI003A950762
MTNQTEMDLREKFEAWAEEVGAQPWGYLKKQRNPSGGYSVQIYTYMWSAWKAASTELVEALEKAQQVDEELCKLLPPGAEYMDPPDGGDVTPLEGVRRMVADYRQRIAELGSRTVTMKLPDYRHERFWDSRCEEFNPVEYQAACIEMWREEIIAQGIKWEAE